MNYGDSVVSAGNSTLDSAILTLSFKRSSDKSKEKRPFGQPEDLGKPTISVYSRLRNVFKTPVSLSHSLRLRLRRLSISLSPFSKRYLKIAPESTGQNLTKLTVSIHSPMARAFPCLVQTTAMQRRFAELKLNMP